MAFYFIGNDPSRWHTHIPTYAQVLYPAVYPGVDLRYHGQGGQLEYDLMVHPGPTRRQSAWRSAGRKGSGWTSTAICG